LIQQIFVFRRIFIALSTTYAVVLPISPTYDWSATIEKSFLVNQKKRHEIQTDFDACKFPVFLKDHKYENKRKRTKSLTMDREFVVCIPKRTLMTVRAFLVVWWDFLSFGDNENSLSASSRSL
jgi:hypothetical protein